MSKGKKIIKILLCVLLTFILLLAYFFYHFFYDTQALKGQKILEVSVSPDQNYTLVVYQNNGGATTDYAVLCSVVDNHTFKHKNIYWRYHIDSAKVKWLDDKTVEINKIVLDVTKDVFDYRKQ